MSKPLHKFVCLALAASVLGLSGFSVLLVQAATWHTLFVKYIQIMDAEDALAFTFTANAGCGYEQFSDHEETAPTNDLHLVGQQDVRLLQLGFKTTSLFRPAASLQRLLPTSSNRQRSFVQHPEPPPPKGGERSLA